VRLGEIGRRHCLRIQDLRTEFRQSKTKVPTRTSQILGTGMQLWGPEIQFRRVPAHCNHWVFAVYKQSAFRKPSRMRVRIPHTSDVERKSYRSHFVVWRVPVAIC